MVNSMNINEQIAVVQHYINIRKNKVVDISIRSPRDILVLNKAYNIAIHWFDKNGYKITAI